MGSIPDPARLLQQLPDQITFGSSPVRPDALYRQGIRDVDITRMLSVSGQDE